MCPKKYIVFRPFNNTRVQKSIKKSLLRSKSFYFLIPKKGFYRKNMKSSLTKSSHGLYDSRVYVVFLAWYRLVLVYRISWCHISEFCVSFSIRFISTSMTHDNIWDIRFGPRFVSNMNTQNLHYLENTQNLFVISRYNSISYALTLFCLTILRWIIYLFQNTGCFSTCTKYISSCKFKCFRPTLI